MVKPGRNPWFVSPHRVWLIATQALAETLHLRLAWLLVLAGAMLVLMGRWLRDFNFGATELKFVGDFGLGAIGLIGNLLAALAMAHLFFSDLVGATAACVLTRPVRRWEFIAGKLAGVMALLAVFVAGLALVLSGMIEIRGEQLGASYVPAAVFAQACGLVWLKLTLVAAMTLLVCSYAGSALYASCAGLLLAVVAHLRPLTEATGRLAWLRLWPNLGLFDPEPVLTAGGVSATTLLGLAGYWAAFIFLFGGLAAYVFQQREL